MKNLTDFRKTVETGVDPPLSIHCDQNIDIDIVVDQFADKPAHAIIMLTDLLTELDMRS